MIEIIPNEYDFNQDDHDYLMKCKFQVELLKKKLSKENAYISTEDLKWLLEIE